VTPFGSNLVAPSGGSANDRLGEGSLATHHKFIQPCRAKRPVRVTLSRDDEQANGRYRRVLLIPVRPGDGLLSETIAGARPGHQELVFMPLCRRWPPAHRSAHVGHSCSSILRRRPLLDLGLMATPTFGWAIALATFYRFGLVMTAFVVPQALTRLQGFRIEQIADANIWTFWAQCFSFPLAWLWASRGDARQPLSLGLALFAAGAFAATCLTPQWQANDFRLALILVGAGQGSVF
jgi:hypothetical protein